MGFFTRMCASSLLFTLLLSLFAALNTLGVLIFVLAMQPSSTWKSVYYLETDDGAGSCFKM